MPLGRCSRSDFRKQQEFRFSSDIYSLFVARVSEVEGSGREFDRVPNPGYYPDPVPGRPVTAGSGTDPAVTTRPDLGI